MRILERLENGQPITAAQYDATLRGLSGRTTLQALLADMSSGAMAGSIWGAGGYLYREVTQPQLGTVTTAGGLHLLVLPIGTVIHPEQFGALADATDSATDPSGTNNTPFFQQAHDYAGEYGYTIQLGGGSYGMSEALLVTKSITFQGISEEQTILRKLSDTVLIENRAPGAWFRNFLMWGRSASSPGPNDRDNTPGLIAYRRCNLENLDAHRLGGPGWKGPSGNNHAGDKCFVYGFICDDSNVNLVRAINIGATRCYGDVVFITRLSGSSDRNGARIEVHKVNIYTGAVINCQGGWRHHFTVYQAEGGRASSEAGATDQSTVLRLRCHESTAEVRYSSRHQQYGAILENRNNIVLFQNNRAKIPWVLEDPQNTLIDACNGFHFFGIGMSRGDGSPARFWGVQRVGIHRSHTSGGRSFGAGDDAGYVLLAPFYDGSRGIAQHHVQNTYGTLLCGAGASTSGSSNEGRYASMQVSVRTQENHTSATLHGEGGLDFGLKLVTLSLMEDEGDARLKMETNKRKRYIAVAVNPEHKRLFRHVHFAGFVTTPYQLIKCDDVMERQRLDEFGAPIHDEVWNERARHFDQVPRVEAIQVVFDVEAYEPGGARFFGRPGDALPTNIDWANAVVDQDGFVKIRS
jgi:hypothetical protein